MPPEEKGLDLEQLKVDPRVWQRLATPLDGSNVLGNVFVNEKENPFQKDPVGSMEKIQSLAAAGKLYLRDFGRSRHFHKVEKDGDNLKLGQMHEMKLSNRNIDLPLSILMWATGKYLRSWGLERIPNWFDKKREERAAINKMEARYKEEFKSLTKEQKNALKDLRKQEKQEAKLQKKLDKLNKEAEKTQQQLDKIQGKDSTANKGEMKSPLSEPPKTEEQNSMQPVLLGDDQNQQQKQQEMLQQTQNLTDPNKKEQKVPAEENEQNNRQQKNEIILNNKKYTLDNMLELSEGMQALLKAIETMIELELQRQSQAQKQQIEQKQNEQQQIEQQQPNNLEEQHQNENPENNEINDQHIEDERVNQGENRLNQENINQNIAQPAPEEIINPNGNQLINAEDNHQNEIPKINENNNQHIEEQQQQLQNNENVERQNDQNPVPQPVNEGEAINAQLQAPLIQPPDLEQNQANIQPQQLARPEPGSLAAQLAQEKQALDAVKAWKKCLFESLAFRGEGDPIKEYLNSVENERSTALTGIACGILTQNAGNPEMKQEAIDRLLSGQPLGQEHSQLIQAGLEAYKNAKTLMDQGNKEPMEKLLSDAALELGQQAGLDSKLTPRNVMTARLVSNIFKISTERNLNTPLNENQMELVQGAAEMGKLAQKYFEARQYLGANPLDLNNEKCRIAVCDLLAGSSVMNMKAKDIMVNDTNQQTQKLMGTDLWTQENMRVMVASSGMMRRATPEQIQTLMEQPLGFEACKVASSVTDALMQESQNVLADRNAEMQRDRAAENELAQPQLPGMNPAG